MIRPYLAAGAVLAFIAWSSALYVKGRADGANNAKQAAIQSTIKQIKERGDVNEDIKRTDIIDICVELGGLPEECGE